MADMSIIKFVLNIELSHKIYASALASAMPVKHGCMLHLIELQSLVDLNSTASSSQ